MSSSIAIPTRQAKQQLGSGSGGGSVDSASSCSNSRSRTEEGFAYGSFESNAQAETSPSSSLSTEGKMRRQSLMSATFSKAEHTVINVGDSESPRLITCVKASQGFDWNQEIFLPSYADYHFDDLERRQDPVQDIILSEEEIKNALPS
ncbi:uncharacterized protein K460DRAFT_364271 [Cucurbitaria berberidis CBS 394.84]|uniref:Uncharacterized protein n=1 Tax=Cucurbitaria berberidis CBS 394.84 TaxID=1168544 RepID=A0A9P4GNL8_9PLEO|nr:uncharacterized protein K460DRAFT_364271 [Cucurbitaria berberidis CBS 394.84]KAF1848305.1 hypothetical protein K460DRAFT_364271 [Cucurbitaria berberidis CBS 394.84]